MTPSDDFIIENAIKFAKASKKEIARSFTDVSKYKPEPYPISVFMAGSPGAGKTESAKALIYSLTGGDSVLRIDADDMRGQFESYNGVNSSLFQAPTSILVEKIHDYALSNKQSFVFDGTFSNFEKSSQNVKRSVDAGRSVYILYVYQDPIQAWGFVKRRSEIDGRHVPKEAFIEQYFTARKNVNLIKEIHGSKIQVDLVVKNIDGTDFRYKENIRVVDSHLKEKYSIDKLKELIVWFQKLSFLV